MFVTQQAEAGAQPAGSPTSQTASSISAASPTLAPPRAKAERRPREEEPLDKPLSRPLDKKRARDRRAQQALRDRTRSTIHNLTEQVTTLTRVVERQSQELCALRARLDGLAAENAQLRRARASLAEGHGPAGHDGEDGDGTSPAATIARRPPWEVPPLNSPPSCIADQLFQGFVAVQRQKTAAAAAAAAAATAAFVTSPAAPPPQPRTLLKPDITSLLDRQRRGADEVSKVASDVVRTYAEIETLPKQVAVHFLMSHLLKWLVLLDEPSWHMVPVWLRPTLSQLTVEHPAWIDRIPWPAARDYLVAHPEITLDQFAATYGTSLTIRWPYDPSLIVITTADGKGAKDYLVNPVFEHHMATLANWGVGDAFRQAFPELARLIDQAQTAPESLPP